MIESSKYLEQINEKIAILRNEIAQSGTLGLTNIHKHCENFIMKLLNLVYDFKLHNLNDITVTFPGLDIGDKIQKIAYQVTSEKTSEKVNETLIKVLRFKHYTVYPRIKIFILSGKQSSYTIKHTTSPFFSFDPDKDINDFVDLLKDIQSLSLEKLKSILNFLESELPYTIQVIKNVSDSNLMNTQDSLIDTTSSTQKTGLKYYEHWECSIKLNGLNLTTASIYGKITEFYDTQHKRTFLPIFNKMFEKSITAKEVLYKQEATAAGAANHYKELVLKIRPNGFSFESAQYKSEEMILTNMMEEFAPVLTLLLFSGTLYGNAPVQIEINIDLSTNGKLVFYPTSSIYSVKASMNTYVLNPKTLSFSKMIHDLSDESLLSLMEEIIHGFVASEQNYGSKMPFLSIYEDEQKLVYKHLRDRYNL